ncbi:unnamed protein product [Adineta steineri]|uniref:Uncharacterized protein n=1 Tax=Adineta steineri TaxID=433720 RepID=A0A818WZR7_9BILA|nr:unnamed protein product [Adineta steineri]
MTNFFRGNTNTHQGGLQQAIEKAIDGSQPSEDWSLIMKICDHVASHEESAKEAMKIIRKRLHVHPGNNGWRSIGYTLTLLEALTKNCGKIFHLQIAHKDFLKELKGVIGPKNNPPALIQERVLGMIQTWALAFRHDPDFRTVEHFYQECKQHGLVFPPAESENVIKTAVPPTGTIERPSQYARSMSQQNTRTIPRDNRSSSDGSSYPIHNNQTADQIGKLRSELDIVQTNAQVFGEMLVTLQPGEENPQDFELLMELHNTCKQMQARIVDLLSQVSADDITVDLLRYNDEFNNSFKTFEKYMQERDKRFGASHRPTLNQNIASQPTNFHSQTPIKNNYPTLPNADNEPALIRFDDDPVTITSGFQNMNINSASSSVVPKSTHQPSTASVVTRPAAQNQDPERELKEMEEWLKSQGDDSDTDEPTRPQDGTTDAFNNFLQKRASAVPDQAVSTQQVYPNFQPINNQKNNTYLKIHCLIFILLLIISYKLTDYYVTSLNKPSKSSKCWPNLLIFFEPTKFCCLCLRDHVYPWLSMITQDDSLVYEAKHVFRFLLATVIRRIQNVDINTFVLERLLPLIFQTCDRYIQTVKINSPDESQNSTTDFLKKMYKNDLHVAMYNRQSEIKYLKRLILDLMPIITPKFIYECKGSRHFLSEVIACQILIDGIDAICEPNTLNRLFHLYFTTAIQRRNGLLNVPNTPTSPSVELLTRFCSMNGPIHKNQLALELTDVMYEKELLNQFSRVLDRHDSIGLLSIYVTLSDTLNDIPSASNILVRKKIYQRLKHIDERYLNPKTSDGFVSISNPHDPNDTLIDDIKTLIYNDLAESIKEENEENKSDIAPKTFDVQHTFTLLSRFHCKIYELVEEKYQRCFLTSDEHFLYICGKRMDSPDYKMKAQNFDEIALDFVHIEEIRNTNEAANKRNASKHYTTTSYKDLEDRDEVHLKCPEETTSIGSNSSYDDRDLNTWRVLISHAEEVRDNYNSAAKYCVFIIEVQRMETNTINPMMIDDEKTHWIVARRYQDFYLLEQKLTEFHGVFSDARLPAKRSATTARNVEFLQSLKKDFEYFLRHLLSKPTLRNSELLYNFLTQPDDFTLPNGEIILAKMFKVVPRRLRIEKGQYLDPFLISLISYAEPAKPKATQPSPIFSDIVEAKLQNSIYGNNANINEPMEESPIEKSNLNGYDSAYEYMVVIAKQIFSASPLLIYVLDLLRIPLKNSCDTFFSHFVDNSVDEILEDEENIIDVIHALRDVIFPNDAEDKGPTDSVNFDDVVAAADAFLPNLIKLILGKTNIENGLQTILKHFQDPLLNKQLFYIILDEILLQLFPELQAHSEKTITHLN